VVQQFVGHRPALLSGGAEDEDGVITRHGHNSLFDLLAAWIRARADARETVIRRGRVVPPWMRMA
jgi:hypothetical protein